MATEEDIAASALYRDLMTEAKARVRSMATLVKNHAWIPSPFIREYCFLQLRMTCEIIALGCLVAHGDIKETHTQLFRKAYKADDILSRLSSLHSDFYPVPVIAKFHANGLHLDDFDKPYLTKNGLIKLYGTCGDILHKGSLKNLATDHNSLGSFDDIMNYGQLIFNLLSVHRIIRVGRLFTLVTILEHLDFGGAVSTFIGEAPPPKINEANE